MDLEFDLEALQMLPEEQGLTGGGCKPISCDPMSCETGWTNCGGQVLTCTLAMSAQPTVG